MTDRASPPRIKLHRATTILAWVIVGLVWPLIWVGGLVTTYDAGMSVPDWPGTYGYNLLLYPLSTWWSGPFDLLIEHGHRLLAVVVGFVAIALVITAWLSRGGGGIDRAARLSAAAVLAGVIAQGALGGARVLLDARTLAMIHGITGPLFFALCVAAAVIIGHRRAAPAGQRVSGLAALSIAMATLATMQLYFGAQLRHALPGTSANHFTLMVAMHVVTALTLWSLTPAAWWVARRCDDRSLSRAAGWLVMITGVQIALGVATWVVHYGYPPMLRFWPGAEGFLVASKSVIGAAITTGHVATGSAVLAVAVWILTRWALPRVGGGLRRTTLTAN